MIPCLVWHFLWGFVDNSSNLFNGFLVENAITLCSLDDSFGELSLGLFCG